MKLGLHVGPGGPGALGVVGMCDIYTRSRVGRMVGWAPVVAWHSAAAMLRLALQHSGSLVARPLWPPTCPAGSKVLYLGAASGTSVSHVSDIVGPEGAVYAVEFSHRR